MSVEAMLCRSKSHRCTSCRMSVFVDEAAEDPGAQDCVDVEVIRRGALFVSVRWELAAGLMRSVLRR
ncbi:hypothetical protein [Streptomyces sp. Rer75]|uniref:hypothetical protein n=1 Tax=unclassified Streptomyces TaxID=2593676 RepID=UPI0015D084BB|nr:hypothetical protein [Streptomyces sp. Rer75]QLH20580.1 hypothetical protein HYQ63_07970 [Streptomyces sp. Rer75]